MGRWAASVAVVVATLGSVQVVGAAPVSAKAGGTKIIIIQLQLTADDGPYSHDYANDTTIGTVLADALTAFEITSDGTTRHYLMHDCAEIAADKAVGQVADQAEVLHLNLAAETIE